MNDAQLRRLIEDIRESTVNYVRVSFDTILEEGLRTTPQKPATSPLRSYGDRFIDHHLDEIEESLDAEEPYNKHAIDAAFRNAKRFISPAVPNYDEAALDDATEEARGKE